MHFQSYGDDPTLQNKVCAHKKVVNAMYVKGFLDIFYP